VHATSDGVLIAFHDLAADRVTGSSGLIKDMTYTQLRELRINALVVDTSAPSSAGAAGRELARLAGAEYVRLAADDGKAMAGAVRERLEAV